MNPTLSEYIDLAKETLLSLIPQSKPLVKISDTPRAFTALLKTKAFFKSFVKQFGGKDNIDSRTNTLSYIVRDALYDKSFDLTSKLIELESFLRKTYRETYPEDLATKQKLKEQKAKAFEKDVKGAVQAQTKAKKEYLNIFTSMATTLKAEASKASEPRAFTAILKIYASKNDNLIGKFVADYFEGSDNQASRVNTFIYTIRDMFFKPTPKPGTSLPSTPSEWYDLKLAGIVKSSHKSKILNDEREAIEAALPKTFLKFLPKTLIVEVDKNKKITAIKSKFAEKLDDIGAKIERQKLLLQGLTKLETKVKKDLLSPDHDTKMKALIVYLMLDTGIRPGDEDNKIKLKDIDLDDLEEGEEVDQYLETYGATTLNKHHIQFIRENYVSLEFIGKKGVINIATISDVVLAKALKDLVDKTKANKKSNYLFLDSEGKVFSQPKVTEYLRSIIPGLNLTDFRKLKSTRVLLEALRQKQEMITGMIYDITQDQVADVKGEIVDVIADVVEQAYKESVKALSHQSMNTTIKSYINPQVILNFLATGKVADKIEDIVFKDQKLVFDPQVFITQALAYGSATEQLYGKEEYTSLDDSGNNMLKKASIRLSFILSRFLSNAFI
jgi:DNA topoisomerase IB